MKGLHNRKNMTRTMAAVWTAACLFMGSTTVYAAGAGVIEGYEALYKATVVEVEEQTIEDQYIEYREEPDDSWVAEEGEVMENGRSSVVSFEWTVGANASKKTPSFEMPSGGLINVDVSVEPANLNVRVGIVEPDKGRRYITGSGRIAHTFSLDQSGSYRVFVENTNNQKVYVDGSYIK